ncbi:hypothetical protein FE257_010454 [Aspergillus nanangensis]|uniref:Rhodopsin domain-containing protein n=1 Tax=Aspergillus nanangensis TaxID=2582783 RepID=A0AAD4GS45_ASPNN|nr:hypothetical protein FE257_010454 [Aspergillus nanangensis]
MADSPVMPKGVGTRLSLDGLLVVIWIGVGLGVIFAAIRMFIRIKRMGRLLADDYFVLFALAVLITNAVLMTLQGPSMYYTALNPMGPDIAYHGTTYVRYEFAIIGLFWTVLWSIKGSFLALYWMIIGVLPRYRWVWIGVTTFTIASYIVCWLLSALNCHPASNYFVLGGCSKPIDQRSAMITICFSTAVDILTDLMIMGIGVKILWSASITARQKIGVGIVFCLGVFIIVAAIVRAVEISDKAYSDIVAIGVWSVAESSISMIIGCLPPFKELVSSNSGSSKGYTSGRTTSGTNASSRIKNRSWSEIPLPLQSHDQHVYRDMEYELHTRDTTVTGGVGRSSSRASTSEDGRPGEIRMMKEFSLVTQ